MSHPTVLSTTGRILTLPPPEPTRMDGKFAPPVDGSRGQCQDVPSTTQRLGKTLNPFAVSDRFTTFHVHDLSQALHMIGEVFTAESPVYPQLPQPSVMAERLVEHFLGSLALGSIARG